MEIKNKILALDVGRKRIGIAISDVLGMFAHPHSSVNLGNEKAKAIKEIIRICLENSIKIIIVGKPLMLSGEASEQLKFTESFIKALSLHLEKESPGSIEIKYLDE